MLIVLTTVSSGEEGERLATKLVETRLAACVQVMPQMMSVYRWKGKIEKENEHLLLIKTIEDKWNALEIFIKEQHPYELPEIVAIDAESVSPEYDRWLSGALD